MHEDLLILIRTIEKGIQRFDENNEAFRTDGSNLIRRLEASLDDPSSAIRLYRETSEQSPDNAHRPFVWDYEVYYRGEPVKLRFLVEKLEGIWAEHQMMMEGGA